MEHEDIAWYIMEELVALIQAGRYDLIEDLWEKMKNLIAWYADLFYTEWTKNGSVPGGIEIDDLIQTGYFALMESVQAYDPGKGAFTTLLVIYLKKHFHQAIGRTKKQLRDPLNRCRSLDAPITDDSDSTLLEFVSSTVCDPHDDFVGVEERLFIEQLHEALEKALDTLPVKQAQAIRLEFWEGCTLKKTAEMMGYTNGERVRQLRQAGLHRIRTSPVRRSLEEFLDDSINYYSHTGLKSFMQTNTRQVERMVSQREYLRQKYEGCFYDNSKQNNLSTDNKPG